MSVERTIKTTGDLRNALADTLIKVESGTIKPEDARMIHKLAHAINDSFFAESKIAAMQLQLQQEVKKFGMMEVAPDNVVQLSKAA
jgi:hypothetical protein